TERSPSHPATTPNHHTATIAFASATSSVPETPPSHDVGVTLTITADGAGPAQLARDVSVNVQDLLTGSATPTSDYTLDLLHDKSGTAVAFREGLSQLGLRWSSIRLTSPAPPPPPPLSLLHPTTTPPHPHPPPNP